MSEENDRKETQVDRGWRAKMSANARIDTQVDEGWRKNVTDIMAAAKADSFSKFDDLMEAVTGLTELVSYANEIYTVKKAISASGSEAVILMCGDPKGNDVAAKVYYHPVDSAGASISARTRVLEYMDTEEGKRYTLPVADIGSVELGKSKYYFEIMPYCDGGDISNAGAFSFDEIVTLTKYLNEALYSIHKAGIIHRDIKPQNLYKTKEGNIVLGDFGTAIIVENGAMVCSSDFVGADGYAAPELRLGLTNSPIFFYTSKVDYYSLGVTLGTLFEGHFVYDDMDHAMITLAVMNGKLPLVKKDPHREQLENLLNGLCSYDAKSRFGYEEVNKWLDNHDYTGDKVDEDWPKVFELLKDMYQDEKSMFQGITKDQEHWEEAKTLLYSKFMEQFFMSFDTGLARCAQRVDELYRLEGRDKGLAIFLKKLYASGPIVWKGYTFNSLSELGSKMVATKNPTAYSELLQNQCISYWLKNTAGVSVDENTEKLVDAMEQLSVIEPEIACYWFGNSFAPERKLQICHNEIHTLEELPRALFGAPNVFYQGDGLDKLSNRKAGADLYGFLFSFGYKEMIDQTWAALGKCDVFHKTVILISMIDHISMKASINKTIIRNFFINYGPIGMATYTQKLVARTNDRVYMALDDNSKKILEKIERFQTSSIGTVEELFQAYMPLVKYIEELRQCVIDNPYIVLAGVYDNKGVVCTNLVGSFAFKIFGRWAPLGFSAWIENGGVKE